MARSARWDRSTCRHTARARAPGSPTWPRTCWARTRRSSSRLNRRMDQALKGHPYVKSALDMACWDILGQAAGLPVCTLLGGRYGDDFVLYRAISQQAPEAMADKVAGYRAEGYRRFQLKVGGDPDTDIAADPRGRRPAAARRRAGGRRQHRLAHAPGRPRRRGVRDVDVYIEQPCLSYEECLSIRRRTDHPFVLDEVIDGIEALLCAAADRAMDVVNLKISKFGGLTKARQIRDLCVSLGIAMTIEDTWGGDIVTAAIAHLAHSTPHEFLFTTTDFNSYVTVSIAAGAPAAGQRADGRLDRAGLGVSPRMEVLGRPVLDLR